MVDDDVFVRCRGRDDVISLHELEDGIDSFRYILSGLSTRFTVETGLTNADKGSYL